MHSRARNTHSNSDTTLTTRAPPSSPHATYPPQLPMDELPTSASSREVYILCTTHETLLRHTAHPAVQRVSHALRSFKNRHKHLYPHRHSPSTHIASMCSACPSSRPTLQQDVHALTTIDGRVVSSCNVLVKALHIGSNHWATAVWDRRSPETMYVLPPRRGHAGQAVGCGRGADTRVASSSQQDAGHRCRAAARWRASKCQETPACIRDGARHSS